MAIDNIPGYIYSSTLISCNIYRVIYKAPLRGVVDLKSRGVLS